MAKRPHPVLTFKEIVIDNSLDSDGSALDSAILLDLKKEGASRWMLSFYERYCVLHQADAILLLKKDGIPVCSFAYAVVGERVYACGTFVERRLRRNGLAKKAWLHVLENEKASEFFVVTSTSRGLRFSKAMSRVVKVDISVA